ncbi:MAG: RNA polymerase sigma factor [Butyricimonas faecihominis]
MKEIQQLEIFIRTYYSFHVCHGISLYWLTRSCTRYHTRGYHQILAKQRRLEIRFIENFLYTMIKNEALNYLRGVERENKRISKLEIETSEDSHVLNLLIAEETNQLLIQAIKQLPTQSARIMRLVLSGYENKEISQVMGVSVNTIKTLKYAAIRKLREYFDSHPELVTIL